MEEDAQIRSQEVSEYSDGSVVKGMQTNRYDINNEYSKVSNTNGVELSLMSSNNNGQISPIDNDNDDMIQNMLTIGSDMENIDDNNNDNDYDLGRSENMLTIGSEADDINLSDGRNDIDDKGQEGDLVTFGA